MDYNTDYDYEIRKLTRDIERAEDELNCNYNYSLGKMRRTFDENYHYMKVNNVSEELFQKFYQRNDFVYNEFEQLLNEENNQIDKQKNKLIELKHLERKQNG